MSPEQFVTDTAALAVLAPDGTLEALWDTPTSSYAPVEAVGRHPTCQGWHSS